MSEDVSVDPEESVRGIIKKNCYPVDDDEDVTVIRAYTYVDRDRNREGADKYGFEVPVYEVDNSDVELSTVTAARASRKLKEDILEDVTSSDRPE